MKNEKKNCDSTEVKTKFKKVLEEENKKNKQKNKTITIDNDDDCVCPVCPTQAPATTPAPACSAQPCTNGRCLDLIDGSHNCVCDSGFTGVDCSTRKL